MKPSAPRLHVRRQFLTAHAFPAWAVFSCIRFRADAIGESAGLHFRRTAMAACVRIEWATLGQGRLLEPGEGVPILCREDALFSFIEVAG
jgi:hypothetical protein